MHRKSKGRHVVNVILVLTILIASVGLSLHSAVGQQNQITLNWWWGIEQEAPGKTQWVEERVGSYEQNHPNIKINAARQTYNEFYPAFRAAFAAKEGPDIMFSWGGCQVWADVWAGAYAPLSDYWSREDWERMMGWKLNTWDGKIWAAIDYVSGKILSYNKNLFKQVGLDPNHPPYDFQELVYVSRKLRAGGITPAGIGIADGWMSGHLFAMLGSRDMDSGGDYIKAITGEESFTSIRYAKWWQRLFQLMEVECWNPDAAGVQIWAGFDLFSAGKAAMNVEVHDPLLAGYVDVLGKDVVGIGPLPKMGTGKLADVFLVEPYLQGITSFSDHKAEAAEFLKHITTKEAGDKFYDIVGAFPSTMDMDPGLLKVDKYPQHKIMWEMYQTQPIEGWSELWAPTDLELEGYGHATQRIWTGEIKTPEEAAEFFQQRLERYKEHNPEAINNFRIWAKDLAKTRDQILDEIYGPKK